MGGQTEIYNQQLSDFLKLWSSPGWVRTIAHLTHSAPTPLVLNMWEIHQLTTSLGQCQRDTFNILRTTVNDG